MSIALEVCRMTEEQVGREQLSNVVAVGLEVGDDAGVEVDNLRFCLEVCFSSPPFRHARCQIVRQQGDILRLSYLELDDGSPTPAGASAGGSEAGAG